MSHTNTALLISLLIIGAGYTIKKLNIIKEIEGKVVSKLILYITFPALILHTVATLQITPTLAILPLFPIIFSVVLLLIARQVMKNKPGALKGVIFMAVSGFNIGLFAYPIIEAIWGENGLQHLAMFDLGNAFVILCISYTLGFVYSPKRDNNLEKIDFKTIFKLLIKSVPLISYTLAIVVNLLSIHLPTILNGFIASLARANMALVLLLLGIYLNLTFDRSMLKPLTFIIITRYGLGLLFGLILYCFLPFDSMFKTIALIGLILPVGLTIIPFSDEFGYDPKLPSAFANSTIIVSFVLMWGLIVLLGLA